jgi:hypothetical protein
VDNVHQVHAVTIILARPVATILDVVRRVSVAVPMIRNIVVQPLIRCAVAANLVVALLDIHVAKTIQNVARIHEVLARSPLHRK